jgi:putative transposase
VLRWTAKVRIHSTDEQKQILAQHFGCARWWWNYALNQSIETDKATGKSLSESGLNSLLPALKKEFEWLGECYSQISQSVSLNLSRAYQNFFEVLATIEMPMQLKTLGQRVSDR